MGPVQFFEKNSKRRVDMPVNDGSLHRLSGGERVIELAFMATRTGDKLEAAVSAHPSASFADDDQIAGEGHPLPLVDHPDAARCLVTLTGLTHLGSGESRDKLHSTMAPGFATGSIRMFGIGMADGKPRHVVFLYSNGHCQSRREERFRLAANAFSE